MSTELEQRLDALASTVASLPKYDQAESPRALDNIREDIGDIQAELKAIKATPAASQGVSVAQVEKKLNTLAHTLMEATAGAFKDRLQITEKRIDNAVEDAQRHTDNALADIRIAVSKALSSAEAQGLAGASALRSLLKNEV